MAEMDYEGVIERASVMAEATTAATGVPTDCQLKAKRINDSSLIKHF